MNDRLEIASRLLAAQVTARGLPLVIYRQEATAAAVQLADMLLEQEMQTRPAKLRPSERPPRRLSVTSAEGRTQDVCATCLGHADHAPTCPERPR